MSVSDLFPSIEFLRLDSAREQMLGQKIVEQELTHLITILDKCLSRRVTLHFDLSNLAATKTERLETDCYTCFAMRRGRTWCSGGVWRTHADEAPLSHRLASLACAL